MAKSEFGFLNFAIRPLFKKIDDFLDDPNFKTLLVNLD